MKQQQKYRGVYKFIFVAALILIVATTIRFAIDKTGTWNFIAVLIANVLMLVVAVMNLRKG